MWANVTRQCTLRVQSHVPWPDGIMVPEDKATSTRAEIWRMSELEAKGRVFRESGRRKCNPETKAFMRMSSKAAFSVMTRAIWANSVAKRSEEKTVAEGVVGCTNINIGKERNGLDMSILVHHMAGHVRAPLENGLTLDTTKIDSLLRVILDDLNDQEAVGSEKMGICTKKEWWSKISRTYTMTCSGSLLNSKRLFYSERVLLKECLDERKTILEGLVLELFTPVKRSSMHFNQSPTVTIPAVGLMCSLSQPCHRTNSSDSSLKDWCRSHPIPEVTSQLGVWVLKKNIP